MAVGSEGKLAVCSGVRCAVGGSGVARPESAFLGGKQNPNPACSLSSEPGKHPILSAAALSKRENRLAVNHRLMAKIECQSKVYRYQIYKM